MKVYIKDRKRRRGQWMFFMHQFVECASKMNFSLKSEMNLWEKWHIRGLVYRGLYPIYLLLICIFGKKYNKIRKNAIIVTSDGSMLLWNTSPYYIKYEIIPMLWDVWPESWDNLYDKLKKMQVKVLFVTVRQMAEKIHKDLGIDAIWIPEGIDITPYKKGRELIDRKYDVLEIGRHHPQYHLMLSEMSAILKNKISKVGKDGLMDKSHLTYPTFDEMVNDMSNYKIMLCFPKSQTNPMLAGGLETLTQRYWEGMLSGCVLLGKAPRELVDFIGYDPVVEVDWERPKEQLVYILRHISDYQELIEKNYKVALEKASWEGRILQIKQILVQRGYILN